MAASKTSSVSGDPVGGDQVSPANSTFDMTDRRYGSIFPEGDRAPSVHPNNQTRPMTQHELDHAFDNKMSFDGNASFSYDGNISTDGMSFDDGRGSVSTTGTVVSCKCDPICQCDPPPPQECTCVPICRCDPPPGVNCVCDPVCQCDPPPPKECTCDPICQCDPPPLPECTCDPICKCDTPPAKECTCDPICECDPPPWKDQCVCDVCECDVPVDETESKFDIFSPRGDNGKAFFEKLQDNLIDMQKEYCFKNCPKPWGVELTEELVLKLLIREGNGKSIVYLPGNQIYPSILARRIEDQDVPCIRNILLQIRSITAINLAYNQITDAGINILASTLQECQNIGHVNLMNNDFTAAGVVTLIKALLARPPLESLKLSGVKFGVEGIDALTTLILGGRSPHDLDISECDLNVEGFQTMCTALYAIDHGIDYPNFLLGRPLPVDLVTLKSIRHEYNEDMGQLRLLDRSMSDTDYLSDPNANNQKCKNKDEFPGEDDSEEEIERPRDDSLWDQPIPDFFEQFSADVLEGLLDVRHRLSEEIVPNEQLQVEYEDIQVQEIIKQSKSMADTVEVIAEFNSNKNFDGQIRHLHIVSPSLYELDVSGSVDFTDEVDNSTRAERHRPSIVSRIAKGLEHHGKLDPTESMIGSSSDEMESPDEFTAQLAAREMADSLLGDASEAAGKTEVPDTTDIVQLVLMSIGDVAQLQLSREQDGIDFTDDECMKLLNEAMERVSNLLSPQVPPHCELSESELKKFVQAFFKSSYSTFMRLFENPYFCMAMAQEGTIACREKVMRDAEEIIKPYGSNPTEEEIRFIATQFLDGAIKEASRMIGTGDPFGFGIKHKQSNKKESDEFSHALKTLLITEEVFQTEDEFEDLVQGLLDASGQMAAATKFKAERVQKADDDFKLMSHDFVEDLFRRVYDTLVDYKTEKMEKFLEGQHEDQEARVEALGHFPFISRPTRLVLNRPFFQRHEELMGSKLGDFIRDNKSIKALHIQKWNLGEDGMIVLMNGLLLNTTLVLLDLANNELGADGVKLLGAYLGVNKNLRHLILNHNRLKDPGVLHLVGNLEGSGLITLNIAYNNVTWVGLDPLLTILPSTKLRSLYLWGNSYGLATWDLLDTLMKSKVLKHTDLCLQVVDGAGCVVKNSQLRDINFWYEVPPTVEKGLQVPAYYKDQVHIEKPLVVRGHRKPKKHSKKGKHTQSTSAQDIEAAV